MITTANPDWDRQFRLWRQHGMDVPDTLRHGSRKVIIESYPVLMSRLGVDMSQLPQRRRMGPALDQVEKITGTSQ